MHFSKDEDNSNNHRQIIKNSDQTPFHKISTQMFMKISKKTDAKSLLIRASLHRRLCLFSIIFTIIFFIMKNTSIINPIVRENSQQNFQLKLPRNESSDFQTENVDTQIQKMNMEDSY